MRHRAYRNIWRPNARVAGGAAPAAGALQRDELPAAALHLHPGTQVSYWQQGSNQGIWVFYLNSSLIWICSINWVWGIW